MSHGTIVLGDPQNPTGQIDYTISPDEVLLGLGTRAYNNSGAVYMTAEEARAFHAEITQELTAAGIL